MTTRDTGARRRFLRRGLAVGGAALSGHAAAADDEFTVPPWTREPGEPVLWHPYGQPAAAERQVVRRSRASGVMPGAASSMTPLADLFGTITPNGLVFERHHAGIPDIDAARHRLLIHGQVRQPRVFTLDDLLRFPSVSRIHFLECSGNTGTEWRKPTSANVQLSHGLLSCCEWTGVPLSALLDEVGVAKGASWVLAEGADGAAMSRSVPLAKALDDALVVYAQNGERLRPEQGYPLRLFLPGWEGNMSIKWLRRLKLGDAPFQTREETSKYTDLLADGEARQFSFEMEAKSVITRPSPGQGLRGRGHHEITGLAWTGRGRVKRVDVSTDGGRSWREARLQGPVLPLALTRFSLGWQWDGGPAVLQSRVTDETGYVQPTRAQLVAARGFNSLYHYNAIQSWQLATDGSTVGSAAASAQGLGLGRAVTEREVARWNIDVDARGQGLPPGRGSVREGAAVYAAQCAACHGAQGEGKPADALVGGQGTLKAEAPLRTIGSYWPFATTLFDYVRRAMPYTAPQSLADDEVYAVSAWLLWRNGLLPEDAVLDAKSLPQLQMPNRAGFVADARPDVKNTP